MGVFSLLGDSRMMEIPIVIEIRMVVAWSWGRVEWKGAHGNFIG